MIMKTELGIYEGDICNREGCAGKIETRPAEGCACHRCAPCSACTEPRNYCAVCGWEEADDETLETPTLPASKFDPWKPTPPRPLDPTKIDYRISSHTHFSQICEGVYPPGTTQEAVRKVVSGTFGGRFEWFGNCRFKFIAYTD